MITKRIIPCLDVDGGVVVKGIMFQNLRPLGDAALYAAQYEEQGADELVILDISATTDGRKHQVETLRRARSVLSIPLTAGGGIREIDDAVRLLESGADKVSINTAAVENPEIINGLSARFGAQCVVVAIDAKSAGIDSWQVLTHAGRRNTGRCVAEWSRECADRGAGEILLTSWDRDGTRTGYDLPLLRAVSSAVSVPVIASGGASGPDHLVEAFNAGAEAVLAASIFHDNDFTVRELKEALAKSGVQMRL